MQALDARAALADTARTMSGLPRRLLSSLHERASLVLDRRGADGDPAAIARDLLAGFVDVCMRAGQDGVLLDVAQRAAVELDDGAGLLAEPRLEATLAAMVGDRARFDPGGPRSSLPVQLTDCVLATLGLTPDDPPARAVALGDEQRLATLAALTTVVDGELGGDRFRLAVTAAAGARCEERHRKAFAKMAAQLDERGRLGPQPKAPVDVVRAVQQALFEARTAIVERVAHAALDRALPVLTAADPELAARLERPISHQLTPRAVAVRRAAEVQPLAPDAIVRALFASLTELLELAWAAPAAAVRAYGARQTFVVGELVEHPTFGRGRVEVVTTKTIEVEFADATRTLVHARGT